MKLRLAASAFALAVFAAACGGETPKPVEPTPSAPPVASTAPVESAAPMASAASVASAAPSAAPAAPAGPPKEGEWDTWSHDQKMAYMKSAVMPKMGPLFHDFDAKRFAEPKCTTCHGSGAKDGSFKMPNPELPKLDFSPGGMKAMHDKKGHVAEFMGKQVVPTMADLLGEKPMDPKTHQGFGCMECHTKK